MRQLLQQQGVEFDPETIEIMAQALEYAIGQLPYPLASRHVHVLAQSILSEAALGERDVMRLQNKALQTLKRQR